METSADSMFARIRTLVALVLACLITPLMGALSGAAHAAVTGTVVTWGDLRGVMAIAAGQRHTVALKSRN